MKEETRKRMDALLAAPSVRAVIGQYLEEQIHDECAKFPSCNKDTFEQQKGLVVALRSLHSYITNR